MNPFDFAQSLGFDKNQIVEFLKKANPSISQGLTQALQAGYTTDQVFQFLSKSLPGKVDKKMAKRAFGGVTEADVMRQPENVPRQEGGTAAPLIGGLVGAGVGLATGGVPGAVLGGMAGYNELNKLTKSYEDHIQSGGSIPFLDFVTKLAGGATLAGVAGAQAKKLQGAASEYLKSAKPQEEQVTPPPPPQDTRAYAERAMENVDYQNLSKEQQKRIKTLHFGLNKLEERGLPFESKSVQNVLKKIDSIVSGEGLPVREQETMRFEKEYEKQPEIEVPEVKTPKQEKIKPLSGEGDESLIADAFHGIFEPKDIEPYKPEKQRKIAPLKTALKSSNVRGATFDEESGKMRIVFGSKEGRKGGTVYEYENMDKETFEKMTGGKSRPITEGSNKFGIWFSKKDPSIGAAFSKFIRKSPEDFPFKQIEKNAYNVDEKQIVESDRAFIASDLFAPFQKQRQRGRSVVEAKALKDMVPQVKDMDNDFVADMVDFLKDQLKGKLKTAPTISRLQKELAKEFL